MFLLDGGTGGFHLLITVSIAKIQPMTIDMTPEVRDSLPLVMRTVRGLVRGRLAAEALAGSPAA